ncbi:MAG: ATP-binding protein [Saprospiraceae bacterium]|nr:ATP-binding protein [Saprospiraceae bacterium]
MHQTIDKMKALRLNEMAAIHHQRATQNLHQDYSVDEYTALLIDQEYEDRQNRKTQRLLQSAKFKAAASIAQIDYKSTRGLNRDTINQLALLTFISKNQNVIFTGPAGVGKCYLAQALGHQACLQGFKTLYHNTARFLAVLKFAKMDGTYLKQLARLAKWIYLSWMTLVYKNLTI